MPKWLMADTLSGYMPCTEKELLQETKMELPDMDSLDMKSKCFIREHYTLIAPLLPFGAYCYKSQRYPHLYGQDFSV